MPSSPHCVPPRIGAEERIPQPKIWCEVLEWVRLGEDTDVDPDLREFLVNKLKVLKSNLV